MAVSEANSDSEWGDWSEDESVPCKDLFSDETFDSVESMLKNCKHVHGLDIGCFLLSHKLDFYSRIMFFNFIRSEHPSPANIMNNFHDLMWKDNKYLKPVISEDPLLQWEFEYDDDNDSMDVGTCSTGNRGAASETDSTGLALQLSDFKYRALYAEEKLSKAILDLQQMRTVMQTLVEDTSHRERHRVKYAFYHQCLPASYLAKKNKVRNLIGLGQSTSTG
jgi:hypothetical protein